MKKMLAEVPLELLKSEYARRMSALRKSNGGGRPKTLKPCPYCGEQFGTRDLTAHKPRCPKKSE